MHHPPCLYTQGMKPVRNTVDIRVMFETAVSTVQSYNSECKRTCILTYPYQQKFWESYSENNPLPST